MQARLLRRRGLATFGVLVACAEVAGRSVTAHVDRALHVSPLASPDTSYYPFLLVGVKIAGALMLAALFARGLRARAAAEAGRRLLAGAGHTQHARSPRLRPGLSLRVWAAAFASTSVLYLVHLDADNAVAGRWALFAPWLHTYALPVFAVLGVLVAVAWRFAGWLYEIEEFADRTLARVRRILAAPVRLRPRYPRPTDETGPRRRFGLAFESRPPPLPA